MPRNLPLPVGSTTDRMDDPDSDRREAASGSASVPQKEGPGSSSGRDEEVGLGRNLPRPGGLSPTSSSTPSLRRIVGESGKAEGPLEEERVGTEEEK